MSTITTKQLSQTALTNTLTTTLYTTPGGTKCIIKEILLCNTDTSPHAVTIRAGATPATGVLSTLLSAVNINAGETKIITLSTVLEATHLLTGGATVGAVVACTISGAEVV